MSTVILDGIENVNDVDVIEFTFLNERYVIQFDINNEVLSLRSRNSGIVVYPETTNKIYIGSI